SQRLSAICSEQGGRAQRTAHVYRPRQDNDGKAQEDESKPPRRYQGSPRIEPQNERQEKQQKLIHRANVRRDAKRKPGKDPPVPWFCRFASPERQSNEE